MPEHRPAGQRTGNPGDGECLRRIGIDQVGAARWTGCLPAQAEHRRHAAHIQARHAAPDPFPGPGRGEHPDLHAGGLELAMERSRREQHDSRGVAKVAGDGEQMGVIAGKPVGIRHCRTRAAVP